MPDDIENGLTSSVPDKPEETEKEVSGTAFQTSKEKLKEITEGIEKGIKDLFASDQYVQYLKTMARFHRYSLNNIIII